MSSKPLIVQISNLLAQLDSVGKDVEIQHDLAWLRKVQNGSKKHDFPIFLGSSFSLNLYCDLFSLMPKI